MPKYLNSFHKVGVVPSIDLSWARDQGGIGEYRADFWQQWPIGAFLQRRGQDGGQAIQLGGIGQRWMRHSSDKFDTAAA